MVNLVREHGWVQHDFAKDLEQSNNTIRTITKI